MKTLAALLRELESHIPQMEKKNEAVSAVPVGWHIEHSLLALVKMIAALERSNPAEYRKSFNLKRTVILAMGKMPRGRARVPDSVKPAPDMNLDNINGLLEKARQKVELFDQLPPDKYFTHPVFGDLRVKKAGRVIAIHTEHHLAIIRDIIRK